MIPPGCTGHIHTIGVTQARDYFRASEAEDGSWAVETPTRLTPINSYGFETFYITKDLVPTPEEAIDLVRAWLVALDLSGVRSTDLVAGEPLHEFALVDNRNGLVFRATP